MAEKLTLFTESKMLAMLPLALMSLAVFFFLTPGYEKAALLCAGGALVYHVFRLRRNHAAPVLLSVLLYPIAGLTENAALQGHFYELATGILVAVAAFLAARVEGVPIRYVLAALALPFVAHVLFFLPRMVTHLFLEEMPFIQRLETLRVASQIGPKLFGQALVLLIPILHYMLCMAERRYERFAAAGIFCLACFCLALLDSRAAYISLAMGIVVSALVKQMMLRRQVHSGSYDTLVRRAAQIRRSVMVLVIVCGTVATVVGWHRLYSVDNAIKAAIHRDQYTSWITPHTWLQEFCSSPQRACEVEASVYLRLSWMLFGMETIAEHPLRIAPSLAPLETALTERYPEVAKKYPVYTDFHSGVVDAGVNYGVLGVLGFLGMLLAPFYYMCQRMYKTGVPDYFPLLVCVWSIWMTRLAIDSVGTHLWYTAWAYAGFVLALMEDRRRVLHHAV